MPHIFHFHNQHVSSINCEDGSALAVAALLTITIIISIITAVVAIFPTSSKTLSSVVGLLEVLVLVADLDFVHHIRNDIN